MITHVHCTLSLFSSNIEASKCFYNSQFLPSYYTHDSLKMVKRKGMPTVVELIVYLSLCII